MWDHVDDRFQTALHEAGVDLLRVPSPNCNVRAPGSCIDTVIIHYTDLDLNDSLKHLADPRTEAGTHLIIGRDGRLLQLVPLAKRAWHAGRSCLFGRPDVNSSSIGIDLVFQPEVHDDYTDVQYEILNKVLQLLMGLYPISPYRITGHEQVALPPGRKLDPGPRFDWTRVRARAFTG